MGFELLSIVSDFYKTKTPKERVIYLLLPFCFGLLSFLFVAFLVGANFCLSDFLNDYLNEQINVMALFITFSLAYLSILLTSSSNNIEILKRKTSEIHKLNQKPITLFQIILIDLTYSVVAEIFLLIYSFIQKYLVIISCDTIINALLALDILVVSHIFILLFRNIKNTYFTFWKSI